VYNAANEEAVARFLAGELRFPDIARVTAGALDAFAALPGTNLDELLEADARARRFVREYTAC
jgi:1-deoxy-D-xylulose-5-phosphate reductoisomerase